MELQSEQDRKYMKMAIRLARKAKGLTSPNPMVGAVIVNNRKIISTGYHKKAGMAHAEMDALEKIKNKTNKSILYVNLEPCSHYGKTPPCTDKIIESGIIKRVVIGMEDPNPLVSGNGIKKLLDAGIKVDAGVCNKESVLLNEVFIKYITSKMPFVLLKSAITLDGKIATVKGKSKWITCGKSRQYVHKLRAEYDAVLAGIGTVIKDNPELTVRDYKVAKNPVRIVIDSKGRIPIKSKVLNNQNTAKTIIAAAGKIPEKKLESLKKKNIEIIICKSKDDRVDLKDLLKKLGKKGITSILLEGGGELNASFLQEKLVDKLNIFIAPKIIGGKKAPGFVLGNGFESLNDAYQLTKIKVKHFGDDILLEAYIKEKYERYFTKNI